MVDSTFFPGRRADVIFNGVKIGVFGIIHPLVLKKFDIHFPASSLEINIEPLL
jgi:phenylalanyl-tRNA synthetase beta chain